jgi:uncharacterized protein
VADFGAFIDFGAERDGLVHISSLQRHLCEPRGTPAAELVRPGDRGLVEVVTIDLARRRVSLRLREDAPAGGSGSDRPSSAELAPIGFTFYRKAPYVRPTPASKPQKPNTVSKVEFPSL